MECSKKILLFLLVSGMALSGRAQTWEPIKEMLKQLVVLRGYRLLAEKGYQIAETGWDTIRGVRKDEYDLHRVFFTSLRTVNPVLKQLPLLAETRTLEERIAGSVQDALIRWRKSGGLSAAEETMARSIYNSIATRKEDELHTLDDLLKDDNLAMEDGDRIKLVTGLYKKVLERWQDIYGFITETDLLIRSRQRTRANNQIIFKLHEQ